VLEEIRESLAFTTASTYSDLEDIVSFSDSTRHNSDLAPVSSAHTAKRHQTIFGFSLRGDALADGPFYNYARCVSWTHMSKKTVDAYRRSFSMPEESGRAGGVDQDYASSFFTKDVEETKDGELTRIAEDLNNMEPTRSARDCGPPLRSNVLTSRRIRAFAVAFLLQAVFGWSAFMIDYTTPTIGVGCRALICVLYSSISNFSCILLALASCISDELNFGPNGDALGSSRRWAMVSVFMRVVGKFLAMGNGIFIIAACFSEFIGVYESCFCKSDYLSLRGGAFVTFLSSQQAAQIARPFWYAGSGVAMLTVLAVCFGYFTTIRRKAKIE
jgi:hypothetical protein